MKRPKTAPIWTASSIPIAGVARNTRSRNPVVPSANSIRVQTQLEPVCDEGCDVNSGEEVSGEFVISGGDPTEILEPAEAAFDDIAPSISLLVETMDSDAIGFVGNDGLCATLDDLRSQVVAVVTFVGEQSAHVRRERQDIGSSSDIGILAGCQMKDDRPAERITQRMDFGRASAARATDRLVAFPPFPPEAQR